VVRRPDHHVQLLLPSQRHLLLVVVVVVVVRLRAVRVRVLVVVGRLLVRARYL